MKNSPFNLKSKAYAFLARRDYGYHELYIKLQKYTQNLDEIKQVLDDLTCANILSEERYIRSYIRNNQAKYSSKKIRYALLQKKVDPVILDKIMVNTDEYSIAQAIWQRKFGVPAVDARERLRQIRFLQSRGFDFDVIMRIIKT